MSDQVVESKGHLGIGAAGHGVWKCVCGLVLKRCKCPDGAKNVHTVSPCPHKIVDRADV